MIIRTQFASEFLSNFANVPAKLRDIGVDPKNVIVLENHRESYGIREFQILKVSNVDFLKIKNHFDKQDSPESVEVLS